MPLVVVNLFCFCWFLGCVISLCIFSWATKHRLNPRRILNSDILFAFGHWFTTNAMSRSPVKCGYAIFINIYVRKNAQKWIIECVITSAKKVNFYPTLVRPSVCLSVPSSCTASLYKLCFCSACFVLWYSCAKAIEELRQASRHGGLGSREKVTWLTSTAFSWKLLLSLLRSDRHKTWRLQTVTLH